MVAGKLAAQVSKLFTRGSSKFLQEQKDILATEPSATLPSTLQLDEPSLGDMVHQGVMQHSKTLPEFEDPIHAGTVREVNEWDRPLIPEKLRRKWEWQKLAHGAKPDDDRPAPLVEMKPFLDLRFRLDERSKLIDDITNDIVSKDALLNTLSNPQSEEVGQIFSFIGDNKTKPFLSKSQTKKYNRPGSTLSKPTTFLPWKEEILFNVKEFNLPANKILVEDGILWKLQHDLHDLISDPKYQRAGHDKLESGIKILSDVLKTPSFKKEVQSPIEYQPAEFKPYSPVQKRKLVEINKEIEQLTILLNREASSAIQSKKPKELISKIESLSQKKSDIMYSHQMENMYSKDVRVSGGKATRFYRQINIEDFVGIARDKRKQEIRKNPKQISKISDWGPDSVGPNTMIRPETYRELQEGIVESPQIDDELMLYSSLERDGFIQGGSQELIQEGVSLSFDPLLSFRKFAKEDLDRMFYVDLPEDMSANDIVNLSSADYLLPEDKAGIILKPNVFNEKEIFVTKEGGFRSKLNVRRLDEDEKTELLRLNRAHDKAVITTDSLQEMKHTQWDLSHQREAGKYVSTTMADRLRESPSVAPNKAALQNIVDTFRLLHKQLYNPKEYASKVKAGDDVYGVVETVSRLQANAADTIRTLYSDIEAYEKQLQGNLIKVSRDISNITNQLRKLKANKSASLDIIKQLYFKTPTYQLVGDMVVMKKLKQRLIELTEINKQHKALSPKGIEALIGDPINADDLRIKLLRSINEALDPVFEKPLDWSEASLTAGTWFQSSTRAKRINSREVENFNNTQSILEEIDDPTFLKIYILNDILKMRDSTRNKSKNFSYEVKNEYADKKRLSPSDVGKEHAERFKKANSRKLTKLWSDYTKANEVTLEFMLKNFGYAMGGIVDMRHGGRVGAAVVAASLMANGGQAMDMRDGGRVGMEWGGKLDKYMSHLKYVEGDVWHKNPKEKFWTSPGGLREDIYRDDLEKMRQETGQDSFKNIPKQSILKYAANVLRRQGDSYNKDPYYSGLSEDNKFLLHNATYNTGQVFKNLSKNLAAYQADASNENLAKVVHETRRFGGRNNKGQKIRTTGADNRAVKDLIAANIININNTDHVKLINKYLPRAKLDKL